MSQTAAKAFKGEEPAGPGGVGCKGETEVRARLHSGWQTAPRGVGRKKARSQKAGTCHGHHRECQRELLQSWMSVRVWGGHPLATFPWALADSGADPQWHAWLSQSTPEPQTQAGASQVNSLAQNNWLDNKHRQKNPEAQQAYEVIYLSCFLGRVLLQNLGLAAGEERGLEFQAIRKQEKER